MLDALLRRYDRVARDEELAKGLEKTVEMYEVLVERSQQLMREARQNRNPLKRQMAVLEEVARYHLGWEAPMREARCPPATPAASTPATRRRNG